MSARQRPTKTTPVARKRQTQLREASTLYVRLLQGCGYSASEIQSSVTQAVRRSPGKRSARRGLDVRYYEESPHVITHWYHDPDLLQPNGQPRPLPLFGKTASVAALVARVNAALDPKVMVAYLLHIGGIRSVDNGWIPTRRYLLYTNDLTSQSWHGFESLLGLLRATEHNVRRKPTDAPWYEARVMSGEIPRAAQAKIDRRTRALGDDYLFALDRELQFLETKPSKKPTRTIRIGVGTYYYELPGTHGTRPKTTR